MLVEGEEDTMAVWEMLCSGNYGRPSEKWDVVSLPNGSSLCPVTRNQLHLFEKYSSVYVCLDADAPGIKATTEIADWLVTATTVHAMELDATLGSDASDYLTGGHYAAFKKAIASTREYQPEGIVNGIDILLDDLLVPTPSGYDIPFSGLQEKLHGVRKGEILTLCGGSGIGKSTLVREIAKSLIEQNLSIANVMLEDQMNVAAQALVALDMNIPLAKFRFHPPPKEEAAPSYTKMVANGKTFFYKHFAGINSDSLMNKLYYYARSEACDFIILDHLSLVISASESNNERKDIDTLMTKLAKMVVETGVGLIQIVHLKRASGDKSFAKGGEVELTDLRGSAALEQLSWTVVGAERDTQGDDSDFSRIRVLKNRTMGFTGVADTVKYDRSTGRMESVVIESPELEPLETVTGK
jgi:twinkle protein